MEFQDEKNITIQYSWCTEYELETSADIINDFLSNQLIDDYSIVEWDKKDECLIATAEGEFWIEGVDNGWFDHQVLITKNISTEFNR